MLCALLEDVISASISYNVVGLLTLVEVDEEVRPVRFGALSEAPSLLGAKSFIFPNYKSQ